jgi:3-phosphoshikimate 1-carboxyvinyltransferase
MQFLDLPRVSTASGTVDLPGSKSISNRILLLAALSRGTTEIAGLLDSDDTQVMLAALRELGVNWQRHGATAGYVVPGIGGPFPNKRADLFMGNAGTAIRPLAAALALSHGTYQLTGVPRMHERPIGDLVDGLRQLGADINYLANEGYPPLQIKPGQIDVRQPIRLRGDTSSQFLTALLMALPLTGKDATIAIIGELISKPYVEITLNLLARYGITVERTSWQSFFIPGGQSYQSPGTIHVEGDASSASYFLAAGVIGGGPVRVTGVGRNSIQGDVRFAETLEQMGGRITSGENWIEAAGGGRLPGGLPGGLKAIDVDLNHIPDAAMTIAATALFADGTTTIRNIASWRVKETDRIHAMATELRKLGATVETGPDMIRITPPAQLNAATIDTYDDHRMAMCFSLAAFGTNVRINDPACVNKTFPTYFTEFARVCG